MATTLPDGPSQVTQREEAARAKFQLDGTPNVKRKKPKPHKRERRWTHDEQKFVNQQASRITPIANEEQDFRHAHWKDKRRRVLIALKQSGATANSIEAFENCGSDCSVEYCKEKQRYRVRANHCKNRHCEPCMKSKGNLLAANLQKKVQESPGKQFRFITLTLKHTDTPLADQLDRLTACFKKLRNSKCWKETQDGGAVMIEVKYDRETGEWHPHLHIVAEGFFLHHSDLSTAWHGITGDSFRVDIRVIKSAKDAAFYVAKYVSKGSNDDVYYCPEIAVEWIHAMKGRRTCAAYGTWRGFKLLEHLPDTGTWKPIGSLCSIAQAAARGEEWAIGLIDVIRADCQYNPHKKRLPKSPPLPVVSS